MGVDTSGYVKVRFRLDPVDGWPPVGSEGLWAEPLGSNRYRIDNTPWFVRNLASDDIVIARAGDDGILWAIDTFQWSGRYTIRVIPFRSGALGGDPPAVLAAFSPLGVSGEWIAQYGIVALDVPADVDHWAVKQLLLAGADDGRWDYEEGCVSDAWIAIT